MFSSKLGQQIGGIAGFLFATGLTYWMWHVALNDGFYYPGLAILAPVIAVTALGMVLFPLDPDQMLAKHGVYKPQKFSHYPPLWKFIVILSFIAGCGNWYAIAQL